MKAVVFAIFAHMFSSWVFAGRDDGGRAVAAWLFWAAMVASLICLWKGI